MATPGSGAAVRLEQLKARGVIPDVVDTVSDELLDMRVLYKEVEVTNGIPLRVLQTQGKPHVELRGSGFEDAKFTLVMVDPDAPKPEAPAFRNWLHWIVVNIPGSIAPDQEIWEQGKEVVPYMGPSPPAGVHRYVFLLFKQEGDVAIKGAPERKKFEVPEFAEQYKLGIPVAGVLFTAKHGDEQDYPPNQLG